MSFKVKTVKKINKDIEKENKQDHVITRVIDKINQKDKNTLFAQSNADLERQTDEVVKAIKAKKKKIAQYTRMKDNFYDFDYYIENAFY